MRHDRFAVLNVTAEQQRQPVGLFFGDRPALRSVVESEVDRFCFERLATLARDIADVDLCHGWPRGQHGIATTGVSRISSPRLAVVLPS
jgi:hypothetical protein